MNWYVKVLQNFANFNGRARRKEYWMFVLFNIIFGIVAQVIDGALGLRMHGLPYGWIYIIYSLAMLIPGIAVGVRRMHDVGKSGWYLLIPIYNLVLACTEGTHGDNEYGQDPKANA
jgi:uncharacterized membrane protein YhaH (DUF805 family)